MVKLTCNVTITTHTFEGDVPFEHSVGDLVTSRAAIAIRHGDVEIWVASTEYCVTTLEKPLASDQLTSRGR